jgi:hypothetical protein
MSQIKLSGNALGTGVLTIAAPNTSTDRTLNLPDSDGAVIATAPGTSGNVLTSNGTTWTSAAAPAGVTYATSAEAIAGTSNTVAISPLQLRNGLNASGSAPVYACRAWVNFNGTGTVAIRASGNVSSITDNGSGAYTINFTTGLVDGNYAVLLTAQAWRQTAYNDSGTLIGTVEYGTTPGTSSVRTTWAAYNETNKDPVYAYAGIFR